MQGERCGYSAPLLLNWSTEKGQPGKALDQTRFSNDQRPTNSNGMQNSFQTLPTLLYLICTTYSRARAAHSRHTPDDPCNKFNEKPLCNRHGKFYPPGADSFLDLAPCC